MKALIILIIAFALSALMLPVTANASTYTAKDDNFDTIAQMIKKTERYIGTIQMGRASWYGPGFHGRKTASGERFNQYAMTAAHRSLPLGCLVEVTNKKTGDSVIVKINDRGPFHGNRVLDLSKGAAAKIGLIKAGVGQIELKVLSIS